jgi:hypothetical protein
MVKEIFAQVFNGLNLELQGKLFQTQLVASGLTFQTDELIQLHMISLLCL